MLNVLSPRAKEVSTKMIQCMEEAKNISNVEGGNTFAEDLLVAACLVTSFLIADLSKDKSVRELVYGEVDDTIKKLLDATKAYDSRRESLN